MIPRQHVSRCAVVRRTTRSPPNDGNRFRVLVRIVARVEGSWYPPPAAVLDAGAPI